MTDQSLALRLLDRNCYDLDPATPFLPTSPVDGMGHGDYRFRNDRGQEIFEIFQKSARTAYSEFGCPGVSPVSYLKTFIPEAELWPPRPGTSWEMHHALGAWEPDMTSWLCTNTLEHYFGAATSLEELVDRSTWLQCEGYKSVFEEARRQHPRSSMAVNWCYNEPWPSAANNSIVNWPAAPKPAYFAVQAACRPVLASARLPRFQWRAGEEFTAELWLLNDSPQAQPGGELHAELVVAGRKWSLLHWKFSGLAPQSNLAGPSVRFALPKDSAAREFMLELTVSPPVTWNSHYRLSLRAAGGS